MKRKRGSEYLLPAATLAVIVVCALWTALTGALWQWPVALAGLLLAIGAAKALGNGNK